MEPHYDIAASAIVGGGLAAALARAYLARTLSDLAQVIDRVVEIRTSLATLVLRLEQVEKAHETVARLDRQVVALETRLHGPKARPVRDT